MTQGECDYVYIPLGGNRVGPALVYVNLVTVFFLCGLWHGASWTFVVWGLFHGLFLVIERVGLARWLAARPRVVGHAYVLLVVMVGWVFFRADSIGAAAGILQAMAGFSPAAPTPWSVGWYITPELVLAAVAGLVGSTPVVPALARRLAAVPGRAPDAMLGWAPSAAAAAALTILLGASLMMVAAQTYNPFIYFRF